MCCRVSNRDARWGVLLLVQHTQHMLVTCSIQVLLFWGLAAGKHAIQYCIPLVAYYASSSAVAIMAVALCATCNGAMAMGMLSTDAAF